MAILTKTLVFTQFFKSSQAKVTEPFIFLVYEHSLLFCKASDVAGVFFAAVTHHGFVRSTVSHKVLRSYALAALNTVIDQHVLVSGLNFKNCILALRVFVLNLGDFFLALRTLAFRSINPLLDAVVAVNVRA